MFGNIFNTYTNHDFPEDWEHENGQYENICMTCGQHFIGHKRRILCRECTFASSYSQPKYHTFIHDINELKFFYDNILPPLEKTDVYFISLSARNKYLSDEEKETLDLGRTEMFAKTIIRKRDWNRFLRTIRKFECHVEGYTTRNKSPIPSKCIVMYININPSNTLQAIANFKKVLSEYEVEIASIALNDRSNNNNIAERLNKIDNSLYTAYQQSRGNKTWIDIDCDINKVFKPHESNIIKEKMKELGLKTYWWIDTKSGYHLLIKRDELHFDPRELTTIIYERYYRYMTNLNLDYGKTEIIINKNAMLPLPGTYAGGHPVKVLNKESM